MNIRKFTGATSRDALRLVREALGADAVVLSNRTLDDGSVEIVALADAELAAITPPVAARYGTAAQHGAAVQSAAAILPGEPAASAARAPAARPAMNPYATGEGGLPDVFSSVFGASAETADAALPAAAPAASPASEPAPWLVEHAKRLTQQRDALILRAQTIAQTDDAGARAPKEAAPVRDAHADGIAAATPPEWANDIVRNVARRYPVDSAAPRRAADAPAAAPAAAHPAALAGLPE